MLPLFVGLTVSNITMLCIALVGGLQVTDPRGELTGWYSYHVSLGVSAGLINLLCHLAVYTYFMATCKWLVEATAKANLDPRQFVLQARRQKSRCLPVVMLAILAVMAAMITGAGADPTYHTWWSSHVHLVAGILAIGINILAAAIQYPLILQQRVLMTQALARLQTQPAPAATTPQAHDTAKNASTPPSAR